MATKPYDVQSISQALCDAQAELAYARPMADAAHAWCAARIYAEDHPSHGWDVEAAGDDLLAAHRATTPSPTPSSHVIVARAELESLRAIADAAGALMNDQQCEGDGDLRVALDAYQDGAS